MNKSYKYILLILILVVGINLSAQKDIFSNKLQYHNFDSVKVDIGIENDSVYSCMLKYYVLSDSILNKDHQTWAIYNGNSENKYFWLGTGSLVIASGFYIAAAWSDPVIYIQSHNKFTMDYYNKAVTKRNIKIIGGSIFAGLAVYFYSKINRKKKVRWIVGPDGIKYTF